ncbi:Ribonuclease P protein component [BD1-7 clade bacterium]|uniref:Ribonuclease P protein component n=1 Tax=BD1-7 clade bacterium TaxID=2029982 RepID=A0A5S9MWC2_9GAMM|nr:Ribonuclease P protein component [BD1-7 clade bacterium]CAA0083222.1 Ribonuclease P protein component [BD1-7 clade bacterium]CAA0116675.1 Ribonuclease P protein component [BD1-7 clade bacterium]
MAKKNVRYAVQRNRIKRIIRESFRLHQHELPPIDVIVLARRGLDDFTNAQLHAEFEQAWQRVTKKFNQSQRD